MGFGVKDRTTRWQGEGKLVQQWMSGGKWSIILLTICGGAL